MIKCARDILLVLTENERYAAPNGLLPIEYSLLAEIQRVQLSKGKNVSQPRISKHSIVNFIGFPTSRYQNKL